MPVGSDETGKKYIGNCIIEQSNSGYIPATVWAEYRKNNHDVMFYVLSEYSGTNASNNLYIDLSYFVK